MGEPGLCAGYFFGVLHIVGVKVRWVEWAG